MRVIAISTLRQFWQKHPLAEIPLRAWYAETRRARWERPGEIKAARRNVSILANNRVVFNIKGNDYRLVVAVRYDKQIMFIRFVGTHAEIRPDRCIGDMTMELKPIKTKRDYQTTLRRAQQLWDAPTGSADADALDILTLLIADYEANHFPIADPDPIQYLEYVMESRGLTRKDLEPFLGSRARVAEVLNRARPLTLEMIRRLSEGLGLPADILVQRYPLRDAA